MMMFLECNGLMFGFDKWKSVWSSLLDKILSEKTDDKYIVVLSSDWFNRQTLFGPESSLFAGFLKDIKDTGGATVGLLSSAIDNAVFPWANFLSSTGLINFVEPVEGADIAEQNSFDIDGFKIINFGNNSEFTKHSHINFAHNNDKTYCFFRNIPPDEEQKTIKYENTNKNICWIVQGMPESRIDDENCLYLDKFDKGIRFLKELKYAYTTYSSLIIPLSYKEVVEEKLVLRSGSNWLESVEEEVFDELAEAGKCGVFWKRGIDTTNIIELRKRMSLGDDADNFLEFLGKAMNISS